MDANDDDEGEDYGYEADATGTDNEEEENEETQIDDNNDTNNEDMENPRMRTRGRQLDFSYKYGYEDHDGQITNINGVPETDKPNKESASLQTEQMTMARGIKMFGQEGVDAIQKEMQQLHDRGVGIGVPWGNLTREEKSEALNYLMFLKRKRCGRIKGRGCADGRKQRAYIPRSDARAPTVSTEAVLLTCCWNMMTWRKKIRINRILPLY